MLTKTDGIVLHSLKHTDSSAIVTIYTRQFGRASYMVYGANKKKSKFRSAFLQPLSLVSLDVQHVPGKEIQSIKDIRIHYPFTGIPFDPVKNSLAIFIAEVLYRTLKRSEADENLYQFIEKSVEALDCCQVGLANFHLVFLLKLTRYLGFSPNNDGSDSDYFDLINGDFGRTRPAHAHFLLPQMTRVFSQALQVDYVSMEQLKLNRDVRYKLLEAVVEYYRLHVPDFYGLNSLVVLHALFD